MPTWHAEGQRYLCFHAASYLLDTSSSFAWEEGAQSNGVA